LRSVQLAVLAGCSTGRGPDEGRDAGADLARAFLLAGVPAVVASSWDVDSQSTSELIRSFYRGIASDRSLDVVLSKAAKSLRQQREHPYYWAAFALYRR
jgi:CHAT domain-containing protein